MAWDCSSAVATIVLRLEKGALTGSAATRRACVKGLCRLALRLPDPTRFALYCFLHDLQVSGAAIDATGGLLGRRETETTTTTPSQPGLAGSHDQPKGGTQQQQQPLGGGRSGGSTSSGSGIGIGSKGVFAQYREAQEVASELVVDGALGVDDVVAPVLCLLDHVYAAEEATLQGQSISQSASQQISK